jgi:tetratricopeptide (TPR) repeat protein/transcriptional regulator with XRE-family HTH domain
VSGGNATAGLAFGQLLRRCRRAHGLSQEELGDRAGVAVRTIRDLERGRRTRPYRHTVGALADALGLRGSQLDEFVRLSRQGPELVPDDGQTEPGELDGRGTPETAAGQPNAAKALRQLPAAVSHFTGREAELDALTGMLSEAADTRAVVISAVAGTAGVGKTAIAVHWAHQVAGRFPDGQLYVNLRGYDRGEPVAAADALAGFLEALGVPGQQIPDGVDERARLYRSKLAGRRMLVLLDNARDSEQARPLLPGDPGCAAAITSRDSLAGLVAADGAWRLDLDVLPLAEAVGLLRSLIGPRAEAEPAAVAELAGLCARLPLALRIAAELAAARPKEPLAGPLAELAESRLDSLDTGEDRTDVRAVFSWSVRQLPDIAREAFALIGLHPGEDLDVHAAAALTGTTAGQARRVLRRLHRASLLQVAGRGRYGMHDLLRAYAREQAAVSHTDDQSRQALTRLFDYYLAAAASATTVLFPAEAHRRPHVPPSAAAIPAMPGEAEARGWLDRERANLAAVVAYCAGSCWPRYAADLARVLYRYLMSGSHLPEARIIYHHALQAARRTGDLAAEAEALNGLGGIRNRQGKFREAADYFRAALERHRQRGDRLGEARLLYNLAGTEHYLQNHQSAIGYYRLAAAAYQDVGDSLGVARTLSAQSGVETELGSYDEASEHLELALPVFRDNKDQVHEAHALSLIGRVSRDRGQFARAADFLEQSLIIHRRLDDPIGVAAQLLGLGEVSLGQGNHQHAIGYLEQARALYRQAGSLYGETVALRALAGALQGSGQHAAARGALETALRLAAETGHAYEQANVHRDLADSHHRAGDDEEARHHWQQALDLYTQLGAPEADQLRSRLSDLKAGTPR